MDENTKKLLLGCNGSVLFFEVDDKYKELVLLFLVSFWAYGILIEKKKLVVRINLSDWPFKTAKELLIWYDSWGEKQDEIQVWIRGYLSKELLGSWHFDGQFKELFDFQIDFSFFRNVSISLSD